MTNTSHYCLLHPDREARQSAQGIPICEVCWVLYQCERREFQSMRDRPFMQRLLDKRHNLKGENDANK